MSINHVQFARQADKEFMKVLRKRVKAYFEEKKISRKGDYSMVLKSLFMLALYFVPYFLMLFNVGEGYLTFFLYWALMGFGMSGIGLSIMHDANHGAYSKKEWVNRLMGNMVYLVGGSSVNWKMQHNVLHHTYTNIDGLDRDIHNIPVLRFSPHQKRRGIHRFQHIYAWLLYCLLTLSWMTDKDFRELFEFKRLGLTKSINRSFKSMVVELFSFKLLYYIYVFALPLIFVDKSWWVILLGALLMHLISGLILSAIFQPAHVVPDSKFPLPEEGVIHNNWMVHQLYTTSNFAPKSKWFTWFVGGLNFQVEHHLFPDICHIHYSSLSPIVEKTAKEFNMPYHSQPTFFKALSNHGAMLKKLGTSDKF